MGELGVIPAPDSPYVELAKSATGRVFKKHILTIGRPFVHPKTGAPITVDDAWFTRMKRNFDDGVSIVQVPVVGQDNKHTEDPLRNAGEVVGLERDGDKVLAVLDIRDPDVAGKLGKTLLGASAMMHMDFRDSASGERRGPALLHCAITNRPHLVDLDDYTEVVAASAGAWDEFPDGSVRAPQPLMLCASEVDPVPVMLAETDPDPEPEHDCYYERPAMHDEDFLRDDIGRLGLLAQQVSSGRPVRLEYAGVITDHDRQAALSAEAQITDADILEATGELAEGYNVSTDAVHAMAHDAHQRSGLGRSDLERARVLGEVRVALSRGQLEVSDEQVLALTQLYGGEEEVLRLTAEPDLEDMFVGLARHPTNKKVTTKTRAHSNQNEDYEDPADEDQPGKGGKTHAEVARYLKMRAEMFGGEALHAGSHGSKSYGPTPYRPPGRSGRPQSSR
jgi:hypothetical protein